MNPSRVLAVLVLMLTGVGSATWAAVSVDQEVAASPQVVRGFVKSILPRRPDGPIQFSTVSISVAQVIRGISVEELTVDLATLPNMFQSGPLRRLDPPAGTELLLFLKHAPQQDAGKWQVESYYVLDHQPPSHVYGSGPAIAVDGSWLESRDELLEYVRGLCGEPFQPVGSTRFAAPARTKWMEQGDFVVVPLTSRTRDRAIQWCRSPDVPWRLAGAQVLMAFNDSRSHQALIELMSDPTSIDLGRGPGHYRWFYVRQAAAVALSNKNPPTPFQVVDDNWLDYATVGGWIWLVPAAAALLMLWTCWIVCRREERDMRLPWIIFILAVFPCAFLVVEQAHSTGRVDEFIVSGGACHRVASFNGMLQYTLIEGWLDPQPCRLASFKLSDTSYSDPEINPVICNYWGLGDSSKSIPVNGFPEWSWFNSGKQSLESNRQVLASSRLGHAAAVTGSVGDPMGLPRRFHTVRIPIDWLLAALIVPPSIYLLRSWRSRRRSSRWRRGGCCAMCGYNLRHTAERCPECGSAVVPASDTELHQSSG